jgi:hypothetical protein
MVPSDARYARHLHAAAEWLLRSERSQGGSAAHYTPGLGWSRPYPETTGYIIPTLLRVSARLSDPRHQLAAARFGNWLLSIQNPDGSWNGGVHPARNPRPSVFNTGQILKGMLALWRTDGDARWIDAAGRGAEWLVAGMGTDGLWRGGDYRSPTTPSYYSHVLWPLLEVACELGRHAARDAVAQGVATIAARRHPNGVIRGWSFEEGAPAFTHTIAYTIRGIQECARLLEDEALYGSIVPALDVLVRRAELRAGALPGAFDDRWTARGGSVCLTGSVQIARCVLLHEARQADLRLVSAAARMVDDVCAHQSLRSPMSGVRGGVAGSSPFLGPYMRGRYPNWAAKYLCDAIMALQDRLEAIA